LNPLDQIMGLLGQFQGRAPNTISLRKEYGRLMAEAQMNGQGLPPFEQWVAENYPDMKILNQQPQGLLGQ